MDNKKVGALIRELRKEKGLTQAQLSQALHITGRAVSKWERGLCAPDLAHIEPLSELLDVPVVQLLRGERAEAVLFPVSAEETHMVLDYSRQAAAQRVSAARRKCLGLFAFCFAAALIIGLLWLWNSGLLFRIDRQFSPDGQWEATVYSRELADRGFSSGDAVSAIIEGTDGVSYRLSCPGPGVKYAGLWWAPDSSRYILALEKENRQSEPFRLHDVENRSVTYLDALLSPGAEAFQGYDYWKDWNDAPASLKYQFLRWSPDSESILFFYSFLDKSGQEHGGCFWFDCNTCRSGDVLKLK